MVGVVVDNVGAIVDGRLLLRCNACFYLLSADVVALHNSFYACFAIGLYDPYVLQGGVHMCVVQYGALYKYDGAVLFLYPLCIVLSYGGVYYAVECGQLG